MKRTAAAVFILFSVASTLTASESSRYIVAMKRGESNIQAAAMIRDIETTAARDVRTFSIVDGFAATLTAEEAATLRRQAGVDYVERVSIRYAFGASALMPSLDETRNLAGQTVPYGIDAVRARDLWQHTRGANINVAVIDTGLDYTHPDIAGVYAGGYNAIRKNNDPRDDNSHGTHVSGTIGAADNSIGVVGVAPAVRLWSVKVLGADGTGSTEHIIAGLDWVVKKKAEVGGNWVVNLSLGAGDTNVAEEQAFKRGVDAGLLIVSASGNGSEEGRPAPVSYPAAYPGVVAVGAIDSANRVANFSNQGPELALVAPGVGVLSTVRVASVQLSIVSNGSDVFSGRPLDGSKKGDVSGEFVNCGVGRQTDFPAAVSGRIAVIQRGGTRADGERITFAEKARNAKAAGATAVVIYNNDASAISWTLVDPADPSTQSFDWPVTIGVTRADGEKLIARPGLTLTVTNRDDDYAQYNGTSMASPHVAGIAALVWSLAPTAPASDVAAAITSTAIDLGTAGYDFTFGNGAADALNAAKKLAPTVFALPGEPDPNPSGRRTLRRGR
ncbi:MAG TPA: S8 family serine peptidase [Thermoanaerobaculia bacterium]|nr:S8 family serine peptidase [Thermoanaerobaculia bacterium]